MLGLADATHAEYGAEGTQLISLAACDIEPAGGPRVQGLQRVRLTPRSFAARVYGRVEVEETFACSFGLDPEYQPLFEGGEMRITGVGPQGEARVVELVGAEFFLGTLFMPQVKAADGPHPLVDAYVAAVVRRSQA